MSKLNQIQNALKEIEGGKFQKLADSYLHRKGYEDNNPLGSVIGSDKTKPGTPDTFARDENGKLVFAEFTTEQNNLFAKLKSDLAKCLDESKTGIRLEEIEEIVFCHNSQLSTDDHQELYRKGKKHGIKISIFGIGVISSDLYQKYPGLAKDFLGISIDTGQILEPDEFVANVGRNRFTTPLDTDFYFRDTETRQVLDGLESNPLVILSGSPGVGKSRLALHVLEGFKEAHPDYEIRCICNRGPDVFEDLSIHFSRPGKFAILVDDANRITRFDYIIDLLQNQREDQQIKVIATVRDYARGKIRDISRALGPPPELELRPLEAAQIKELVQKQYEIGNQLFLDRIARIAGGNPRLAIMAARITVKHKTLESIRDVSGLYDEYFASISNDLQDLQDEEVLKVAAIISFFRVVDLSHGEMMDTIKRVFGITPEIFWRSVERLHSCEAVDIHEREVVKISDQVFATYLFYLCFFRNRFLDFAVLLENFFPHQVNRLRDAIYPCLNSFDFAALTAQMRPHVHAKWETLIKSGNTEDLHRIIELFWFLLQTDTLLYLRDRIENLDPRTVDLTSIAWTGTSSAIDSSSILNLLALFNQASEEGSFRIALDLAYNYVKKRPNEAPQLLRLLTDGFGFTRHSHRQGYILQKIVIETLLEKTCKGQNELFSRLFLEVSKEYLHTRFDDSELSGRTLTTYSFDLLAVESMFELRKAIWDGIFELYHSTGLQTEVLKVLKSYSNSGYRLSQNRIVAKDSEEIIPFIEDALNPNSFSHCLIVQDYIRLLHRLEIPYRTGFSEKFKNETYVIYKLLCIDYSDRREMGIR